MQPPCLNNVSAADFTPTTYSAKARPSQATATAYHLASTPRALVRRAAGSLRSGARRLRSSLATPAFFAARRRPAFTTFTPTVADGWTKTYVNWC